MPASRLPALVALLVMLVSAPVPWRVSAHADEHHGHVWLPDDHAWDHLRDDHRHHHHDGAECAHDEGCCTEHDPACPERPDDHDCHCDDAPLATGMLFAVVVPPAHLPSGSAVVLISSLACVGAPEVASSDPGGSRRACEEDPIVLLR